MTSLVSLCQRLDRRLPRPTLSSERLTLIVALAFTLFYNGAFWQGATADLDLSAPSGWLALIGYAVVLTGLQYFVFLLGVARWNVKPLLSVLILIAAAVSYFTDTYGTYFDTTMIDNVAQTDVAEASELITPGFILHLVLYGVLPVLLVWRVDVPRHNWKRRLGGRVAYLASTAVVLIAAILLSYSHLSPLMRNHKELRYLVTPGNYLVSSGRVLADSHETGPQQRLPLGEDATRDAHSGKPRLLVIVVGETLRAANWGLDGYRRQTTPRLAKRDLVNYSDVSSCGTSTAVSVPCLFSPWGHDDYDEDAIASHQSLLDILQRTGIDVTWIDNQSGCKGVCDGVDSVSIGADTYPQWCDGGRCLDEALVEALRRQLDGQPQDRVIVLHQLGNHGPSYFDRYPPAFRHFTPECRDPDLSQCERQTIINAYDNAVLYTDHVLDALIGTLKAQDTYDSSLIYLSDHGESLGEHGLYLHGLPYAIAPDEQTHVPMIWWLSTGFQQALGIDEQCLEAGASAPHSQANLFHTVLGVSDVKTRVYRPELDLSRACR